MNVNMIRPKNETEDLLLSAAKNCESLLKQTHRKPEEMLEFKITKPRETIHFKPPISIEGSWMIGLTSFEVYISIFIINHDNTYIKLYAGNFDQLSSEILKDEHEKILSNWDITPQHLQHEKVGPRLIEA